MGKKKDVGKGIRALLSNIEQTNNPKERQESIKTLNQEAARIPLVNIEANPFQPRKEFDSEELMDLAKSIKTFGLIQPVTVRSVGGGQYQLISGERRVRASRMAGLSEVPAFIRVANDQEMLEMALVENIQRMDLNALEVAISYQRLIDECNLTHEEMSNRVGKNRSTITNYLRILKLPPDIQNAVKTDRISMGHARVLAGIESHDRQLMIFHQVVGKNLSVRDTEKMARSFSGSGSEPNSKTGSPQELPQEVVEIRDRLSAVFGSRVDIRRNNKGAGNIVIKFRSNKEFNYIVDLLDDLES